MVLLHGLPDNQRNLDLAQSIRSQGRKLLTFKYCGAKDSPVSCSLAGAPRSRAR